MRILKINSYDEKISKFLFNLRNKGYVRNNSINNKIINYQNHKNWLIKFLKKNILHIITLNKQMAGYIRLKNNKSYKDCSWAILKKYQSLELSPTLDLRVDYMKPAEPHKSVYGFAECYRLSPSVAFTRAIAYQDSIDEPIAHAVGSFMRISPEMVGESFRQALMGNLPETKS